ncbi:MAG: MarC family protein [Chlamydia sp.]
MPIFTLTITLFLIMNPLGNAKQFLAFLSNVPEKRVRHVIIRELFIALATIFSFSLLGEYIFSLLSIQKTTVFLSSGIILFLSAMKILFSTNDHIPRIEGEEPFVVPLAIPMIAGPALLATVMLYSSSEQAIYPMIISILLSWAFGGIMLLLSPRLLKVVGNNGLLAMERLMGMVLVLISIQRFMEGVALFVAQHK